jgi:RND family efflux transporter MFP subunit
MSLLKQIVLSLFIVAAAYGGWYAYHNSQILSLARETPPDAAEAQMGGPMAGRSGRIPGVRGRDGAINVITADVEADAAEETMVALGTAKASRSVTIFAQVTGIVEEVAFSPGEPVEADALLVKLEDAEQEVALERARIARDDAREALERAERLSQRGAISEVALSEARTAARMAETEVRNAEIALARRQIRAPFAGITGLTDLSIGDLVTSNNEIVTIDDLSAVRVGFEVPERWVGRITRGTPIRATARGLPGEWFPGSVTAVDSRVDAASRTLRLEATIDNEDRAIKPGMSVTVEMTFAGEERLAVPTLAVQWDRGGSFVWKLDGDIVRRAEVTILRRRSGTAVVIGDVARGDRVVVEGVQRLRDGVSVAVVGDEPTAGRELATEAESTEAAQAPGRGPERARN